MVVVHFFENTTIVLSQLLRTIPSADEMIKIKGRKGKIIRVQHVEENIIHVHVVFEKVSKHKVAAIVNDTKKRRR